MTDRELTPSEKRALNALPTERTPGDFLEERVVRSLRDRGLLRKDRGRALEVTPFHVAAAIAASLLLVVGGFAVGRLTLPSARQDPPPTARQAHDLAVAAYEIAAEREDDLRNEALRSADTCRDLARALEIGPAATRVADKNLLNVLKGGSYMVRLGLSKDDKKMLSEGWGMVEQGINNMTEMSKSMLDFAKERDLDLRSTDLNALTQKIHALSAAKFRDSGVELSIEVPDDLPAVECDPEPESGSSRPRTAPWPCPAG